MTAKNARVSSEHDACQGKTQAGKPCQNKAQPDGDYCKRHADQEDWAPAFFEALATAHTVSAAVDAAGVSRAAAYARRHRDLEFAERWDDIECKSTDLLEREAYRRAAVGTDKPVYQGGERVGVVREYSDTLLIFLLKARKPDTYRERHQIEHSGTVHLDVQRAGVIAQVFREVFADPELALPDEVRERGLRAAAKHLRHATGERT